MPKARVRRISVEEQGQRAARSTDVYLSDSGTKGVSVCTRCSAYSFNKRWYMQDEALKQIRQEDVSNHVVCPACKRMEDNVPEGYVTLKGDYMVRHEEEILNRVRNVEAKTRARNPLARIMSIEQEGDEITIKTTDDKLAQHLGRDIFKAHSGELHYRWGGNENFLRVDWSRYE